MPALSLGVSAARSSPDLLPGSIEFGWAAALPRRLCALKGAFAFFVRTALRAAPSEVPILDACSMRPCPPPFSWQAPIPSVYGRMSTRDMRDFAVRVWCNCIILALTHLSLGGTRLCPPSARTGSPLTPRQLAMAADVRRLVDEGLRPPFLQGGRGRLKLAALADYVADLAASPLGTCVPPPATLASVAFDASRAKFLVCLDARDSRVT